VDAARRRVDALEALEARVRAGEVGPEELEEALPDEVLARGGGKKGRGDAGPSLPYQRFRSSGGLEIRVGKGPRQNDDLTFHHSAPDDVWLHAQQVPGAHVILRWGRHETPPARDLAEAAVLAALHSKARTSGSVPVQWTFRKYVRSPRKAPPGLVVPREVQTVFVEPDPAVAERLAVEE
jgi:predicted ribosome quality control (RQC) complex YloA/Tae2 family protein